MNHVKESKLMTSSYEIHKNQCDSINVIQIIPDCMSAFVHFVITICDFLIKQRSFVTSVWHTFHTAELSLKFSLPLNVPGRFEL